MRKIARLTLILAALAASACGASRQGQKIEGYSAQPFRFIHPKASVATARITGTEIPVQLWVEQDSQNRGIDVYWGGSACGGRKWIQLDGEYEPAVQPPVGPFTIRATEGTCTIVADLLGPGGKLLRRITHEVLFCGGSTPCE